MDARLRISRFSGWARYRVVLDSADVAALGRGGSAEMEVAPGTHTLQVVYALGLESAVETFTVRAGETAAFVCRARPRLRGPWIALERAAHHEEGSSSEHERDLIKQIQAAQNQPGLPR